MSTLFALLPVEIRLQLVRVASDLWPVLDEVEDLPPTLAIDYDARRRFALQAARYGDVDYCRRYIDFSVCGPAFVGEIVRYDRVDLLEFASLSLTYTDIECWDLIAEFDAVKIFARMCEPRRDAYTLVVSTLI